MKTIFLLIGVRGAGKTTLLNNLNNIKDNSFYIMSSSTTRPKREKDEFILHEDVKKWNDNDFLYHISIGDNKYGLRKTEVDKIENSQIGITLYSPSSFEQIEKDQNNNPNIQFVTIGIDTIETIEEQEKRVGNDESRIDAPRDFDTYIDIIRNQCSITLKGDENSLVEQICTIGNLFIHGGVVAGKDLEVLLKNNLLVKNPIIINEEFECASYNFHVGDEYFISENNKNKNFKRTEREGVTIKPYTYVLVQTKEVMNLPSFIIGNFDLTVKLFHHGLIMSASTQIDPGYRGTLTCLLYNTSDEPIILREDDEFLTVQYITTTCITKGYKGARQKIEKLDGQIYGDSRIHSSSDLNKAVNAYKKGKFAFYATIIAAVLSCAGSIIGSFATSNKIVNKAENEIDGYKEKVISEEFKQDFYQTFKQDIYQEMKNEITAEIKQDIKIEIQNYTYGKE
ncbi:MAG: hypothetical protein J5527_05585 [Treponema sp.]|nr:hypothetical protein [Treponema sp.]